MPAKRTNKNQIAQQTAMLNRAATYLRVSTDEQAKDGYGLDVQRQQTEAYALAFGLDVTARYVDEGISGTKFERPGLNAVLEAARAKEFDILIVPAIDRLARRASLLLKIWDELESAGVAIVAVKERIDTSTPAGRLMRTMFAGVAEFERDSIVARTAAGRNERGKRDGEKGGRVPYGYIRTVEGAIQVDENAAMIVRKIFALHQDGKSLRQIAAMLEDVPTSRGGKHWYASSVSEVLKNESDYRGGLRGDSILCWPSIL